MSYRLVPISETDLQVTELCLGANVFGWTTDRETSFAILDAFLAAGGNFIDTADVYSAYAPGNVGGESEAILGEWFAARPGARDKVVLATKVGQLEGRKGLSPATIAAAAEDSLRRLQTDRIDLYYAHLDDPQTPIADSLGAFGALIDAGKVRSIAASNFSGPRLRQSLATSAREGLPRYAVLQAHYNLVERPAYESELRAVCEASELGCIPYFSLAMGFLTGKYRPGETEVDSPRAKKVADYLNERGFRVLAALDEIATARDAQIATVALAWLRYQPTVLAPAASASSLDHLQPLLDAIGFELSAEELERLDQASG